MDRNICIDRQIGMYIVQIDIYIDSLLTNDMKISH